MRAARLATSSRQAWLIYTRGQGHNETQVRHVKDMNKSRRGT